jgi:hypothetical protein
MSRGDEAYIHNFGTDHMPIYRVLVCEVLGKMRQAVTYFRVSGSRRRKLPRFCGSKSEEATFIAVHLQHSQFFGLRPNVAKHLGM